MKTAQSTRWAAVAVVSVLAVATTSASAASGGPQPLPGPAQATPNAASVRTQSEGGEGVAEQVLPTSASKTAPPEITGTQTAAAAPQTTAVASSGRAKARFDMDGDGRDELVVGSSADPGGFVLHVHYSGLARRETLTPSPTTESRFWQSFTAGDFNGDGFQDLAVGGQRMISQGVFEFGIFVYDGSPSGLDRDGVEFLAGLQAGLFASGDVNNDGRDELAVTDGGTTEERDGPVRGSVTVLWGTANGLTKDGLVVVRQVVPLSPGMVKEVFGGPSTPLAMGDYTGDGYDDLVVVGDRQGGLVERGIITLFPGSARGLNTTNVTKLEGEIDVPGSSLPVDAMVMSEMNQDGREDLLLGLPRHVAGKVIYLPGAAAGLSLAGLRLIDQNTPGIPGQPDDDPTGAFFGYSLATGDATGDGIPDLLVGAIAMSVGGVEDAGSVTLIPGTAQGPSGVGSFVYTQHVPLPSTRKPDPRNPDPAERNDYLGSAVAILDLDGTGPLEMLVESKYEDVTYPVVPSGLITTLRLEPNVPRRGSSEPPSFRLVPVKLLRPADFEDPGFEVLHLGAGLLRG